MRKWWRFHGKMCDPLPLTPPDLSQKTFGNHVGNRWPTGWSGVRPNVYRISPGGERHRGRGEGLAKDCTLTRGRRDVRGNHQFNRLSLRLSRSLFHYFSEGLYDFTRLSRISFFYYEFDCAIIYVHVFIWFDIYSHFFLLDFIWLQHSSVIISQL